MIEFRPFEAAGLYEKFTTAQRAIVEEVVKARTLVIDTEFSSYVDSLAPHERRQALKHTYEEPSCPVWGLGESK